MSDILIKGMKLPKDPTDYLHLIIQDGKVHTAISCGHLTTDKLNIADAIELPYHGRLIDADFYKKYAVRVHNAEGKEYIPADFIDIAPTVLEASTEEKAR